MPKISKKMLIITITLLILFGVIMFYFIHKMTDQLIQTYQQRESMVIYDRNENIISIEPNQDGYYALYNDTVPQRFTDLLIQKEDKFFYAHPGINPISAIRAGTRLILGLDNPASSTITQQLVKILRGSELDRNFRNKIIEALYAISIEVNLSKKDILRMYTNSIFFGNQTQGLTTASKLYFDTTPQALTDQNIIQLISAIPSPSKTNPFMHPNIEQSYKLAQKYNIAFEITDEVDIYDIRHKKKQFNEFARPNNSFEINMLNQNCAHTTIDSNITDAIREILKRNIGDLAIKNATHAAVVILKQPENEIIALVGSPWPESEIGGYQINMAIKPRPIGSTIKPLIYLKGFENNLRPYTLVDDKEYKYTIGDGYAFYPKNYDYEYRGTVTLHYALSNSLNVPTVKVLEYVGLEKFYKFLLEDLEFEPIQNLYDYQLSIALGGLEMDLLTLTYYMSIFGNNGILKPLTLCSNAQIAPKGQTNFAQNKQIADSAYIELVNKILTDRKTGVEQFGITNNLIVPGLVAAAKTGTSREFHDSWTIGFTPDFVVGVWLGNAENTAMDNVSGEGGAGKVWNEIMQLLSHTDYNRNTEFIFDRVHEFKANDTIELGLDGDDYDNLRSLLTEESIIIYPHNNDIFLLEKNTRIPLRAQEKVEWYINGELFDKSSEVIFEPKEIGTYKIESRTDSGEIKTISILLNKEE